MAGENLDNFVDVKNILVEMGTYFQVQVILDIVPVCFDLLREFPIHNL